MQFYLDSAREEDIRGAAKLPFVAGVTTNPELMTEYRALLNAEQLIETVVSTSRMDWKLWLQLPAGSYAETVAVAERMDAYLARLTGDALAGPTLVFKLVPTPEALWAASTLSDRGKQVCVTGIANVVQALTVASAAHVHEGVPPGDFKTEGPPASRNPAFPQSLAFYVGRALDHGRDAIAALTAVAKAMALVSPRTRILAASIRNPEMLVEVLSRVVSNVPNVDVTVPPEVLGTVLEDSMTADSLERFARAEKLVVFP
jgi:transaldolase